MFYKDQNRKSFNLLIWTNNIKCSAKMFFTYLSWYVKFNMILKKNTTYYIYLNLKCLSYHFLELRKMTMSYMFCIYCFVNKLFYKSKNSTVSFCNTRKIIIHRHKIFGQWFKTIIKIEYSDILILFIYQSQITTSVRFCLCKYNSRPHGLKGSMMFRSKMRTLSLYDVDLSTR